MILVSKVDPEKDLIAPLELGSSVAFANLARRSNTTVKLLGISAVRQLLAAARTGSLPIMSAIDTSQPHNWIKLWLHTSDRDELETLSNQSGKSIETLASLAVRHVLVMAESGASPIAVTLKPPKEEPEDVPSSTLAARINLSKAKLIIQHLQFMSLHGLHYNSLEKLKELEALKTIDPY